MKEKEWEHAGLSCTVIFTKMGEIKSHRCGYVRVTESHPLFEVHYNNFGNQINIDTINDIYEVHGGVTFSGTSKNYEKGWWIGFDCAHLEDRKHPDYEKWANEKGMNIGIDWNAQFRGLDYVVKETNKLADALNRCKLLKNEVST
jgi:hypothetical protein